MDALQQVVRKARSTTSGTSRTAYVLIARGPDGRLRSERFKDAAAYKARLASLEYFGNSAVSIDEIAGLLDT